jgi:hypothetical protein
MIALTCDKCKKKLRLRDELSGRHIKCPGCGATLTVPEIDDEDADAPAPKKQDVTFTPVKPRGAPKIEDEDAEGDPPPKRRKPSPLFLIAGLILGIGGLIAMAACIVFAKQANDRFNEALGDKEHILKQRQLDLQNAVNEQFRKSVREDIAKLENEIQDLSRDSVMRYSVLAVVFCGVFLFGFGIRGYHHIAMKKWHAETHKADKPRRRRRRREEEDEEDQEDEE